MASKKKHTAKCNVKISDLNHSPSSQKQDHGVKISPKANPYIVLEMNTLKSSGLETQLKDEAMTVNASTSRLQETTPASPPSSKAERNRRKKENAKNRKSEESQKKSEEADLLLKMSTMSLNKRGVDHDVKDGAPGRLWEIKPSWGKGLGVFAKKDIKKGAAIFQEMPLIQGGPHWLQKEAAFTVLSIERQRDFMELHNQCNCHQSPCVETPFMKIFDANSYRPEGYGHENADARIYKVASRINHACFANTSRTFTTAGSIVIFSIEDIKKGEELTIDYVGTANFAVSFRGTTLQFQYGFKCFCKGCIQNKVSSTMVELPNPDDLPCSDILGKKLSEEEVKALEYVELWYKALEFQVNEHGKFLRDLILKDYIEGVDRAEHILNTYEKMIAEWLGKFNDFDLDEDVIAKFQARTIHPRRLQMTAYIQDVKSGKSPVCFVSGVFDDKIEANQYE